MRRLMVGMGLFGGVALTIFWIGFSLAVGAWLIELWRPWVLPGILVAISLAIGGPLGVIGAVIHDK